jgi:hypothetical protein
MQSSCRGVGPEFDEALPTIQAGRHVYMKVPEKQWFCQNRVPIADCGLRIETCASGNAT